MAHADSAARRHGERSTDLIERGVARRRVLDDLAQVPREGVWLNDVVSACEEAARWCCSSLDACDRLHRELYVWCGPALSRSTGAP